jgi:hypothetical protein
MHLLSLPVCLSVRLSVCRFHLPRVQALNELVVSHFLSKCKAILADKDPIPQFALKLLCALVEANSMFGVLYHRLHLTPKFLACLAPDSTQCNLHTIKLVGAAVAQVVDSVGSAQVLYFRLLACFPVYACTHAQRHSRAHIYTHIHAYMHSTPARAHAHMPLTFQGQCWAGCLQCC